MLTLRHLLSLPTVLSLSLITHVLASPSHRSTVEGLIGLEKKGDNGGQGEVKASLTGGEGCNDDQMKKIRGGFKDMMDLFAATDKMNWDRDAEREYFGTRERMSNWMGLAQDNLSRARQYSKSENNTIPDIHVRCDDPHNMCKDCMKGEGRHVAYNIQNEAHINFCHRYFSISGLDDAVQKATKQNDSMNIMEYYNRGTAWARELMHIATVGTCIIEKPIPNSETMNSTWRTERHQGPMQNSYLAGVVNDSPNPKYAYGAIRAKLIAKLSTQEPYDAPNNPENYALYAQARYVMAKKNFYPSLPSIDYASNEAAVLSNDKLQDGQQPRYACFDQSDVMTEKQKPKSDKPGDKSQKSAASTIKNSRPHRTDQAFFALIWALVYCFAMSM